VDVRFPCVLSIVSFATAPNQANTQWQFGDGKIRLTSNPALCMTGPTKPTVGPHQFTVELCDDSNPGQSFYFHNETVYPTTIVSQGSYSLGLVQFSFTGSSWPGDGIFAFHSSGAWVTPCDVTNAAQQLTFLGFNDTAGVIQTPQGLCLSGKCITEKLGCLPVPFVACDESDSDQLFLHNKTTNAFIHPGSNLCLGLLSGLVCVRISESVTHFA
jgi:hypothetical protein